MLALYDGHTDASTDSSYGPRGYDEVNRALAPGDFGWPYCIADARPFAERDFETGEIGLVLVDEPQRPGDVGRVVDAVGLPVQQGRHPRLLDGTVRLVEVTAYPLFAKTDEMHGVVAIFWETELP